MMIFVQINFTIIKVCILRIYCGVWVHLFVDSFLYYTPRYKDNFLFIFVLSPIFYYYY